MKKIYCIIAVLLCVSLTSCAQMHTGEVLQDYYYNLPCADDTQYTNSLKEYPLWTSEKVSMHENKEANKTVDINFNGKEYTGTYWYSSVEFYNTYESDFYEFDQGWFSVKAGTKELDSIAFYGISKGNCSEEKCLAIAKSIAEEYINIDEYELCVNLDEEINYYSFIRKVNGIETADRLSVGVDTSGEIITFNKWMCDEFKSVVDPYETSAEWMTYKADELLNSNYEESVMKKVKESDREISNVSIENVVMVALGNSDYGLAYTVNGEIINKLPDGSEDIEPILINILSFTAENNSIFAKL